MALSLVAFVLVAGAAVMRGVPQGEWTDDHAVGALVTVGALAFAVYARPALGPRPHRTRAVAAGDDPIPAVVARPDLITTSDRAAPRASPRTSDRAARPHRSRSC